MRVAAVVLAAGAGSRFGGGKLLAPLDGRPILQHVVDGLAAAGLTEVVVVTGSSGAEVDAAIAWRGERRMANPRPADGLSSSLRIGLAALPADAEAALVALGDQPRLPSRVIAQLVAAGVTAERPFAVPRYAGGANPNPVLVHRSAWPLADGIHGDRGFGPLLAARPELVTEVPMAGQNPDVDTRADLLELAWADRVRANRDQVDRVREVPDGPDFYARVSSLFRADPDRTDEPVLDLLRGLARPGETWLDVGAGAGRYALPLARIAREVIAVDPSEAMLAALREIATVHGIANVRTIAARWPMADPPTADVTLIAHVGYDIEAIGPFVDALEAAASRLCVAVLMERQPSSIADVLWPPVHGEERVALPALPEFVELLRVRGRAPDVVREERAPRWFTSRDELIGFLRQQLWVADGTDKDRRFHAELERIVVERDGGFGLISQRPLPVGLVTWAPPG